MWIRVDVGLARHRKTRKLAARLGYRPYAETTYSDHAVRLFERRRPVVSH